MPNHRLPNDIPRRVAFLEKVYHEDRERWRKFEARQDRNDARFKTLFAQLKRQNDELKRQGDRLDRLMKAHHRRSECGNG